MSLPRFLLPIEHWSGPLVWLDGDEAAHCTRVRRLMAGDRLEVFDGQGRVAEAVIARSESRRVELRMDSVRLEPRPALEVWLLPALLKTEAFETVLAQAVELGAAVILPIVAQQGVVHATEEFWQRKQPKWQRLIVEAGKQSHQAWLPRLMPPMALARALPLCPAQAARFLLSLEANAQTLRLPSPCAQSVLLVGPEGDWSVAECEQARAAGFVAVTLGKSVLRAETACVAAMAALGQQWRQQTS